MEGTAFLLNIEVQGLQIVQIYAPPRGSEDMHRLLVETFVQCPVLARDSWLMCGDFNETPNETAASLMTAFGNGRSCKNGGSAKL